MARPARLLAVGSNDASTSFGTRITTVTKPATNIMAVPHHEKKFTLWLTPFGIGSDNQTFSLRLIGWRQLGTLWTPVVIADVTCILSAEVGIAAAEILDTERFVDTIANTTGGVGSAAVGIPVLPVALIDKPAVMLLDVEAYDLVEALFDMTGATNGNVLYQFTE